MPRSETGLSSPPATPSELYLSVSENPFALQSKGSAFTLQGISRILKQSKWFTLGVWWRPCNSCDPALEATQGQMDGFFSQLPYKCHLEEVASVGDCLNICPQLDSRVGHLW